MLAWSRVARVGGVSGPWLVAELRQACVGLDWTALGTHGHGTWARGTCTTRKSECVRAGACGVG
jgi:hypothetical protein